MGSEMEPAKREDRTTGRTLVPCLTHSVSRCQSVDMFEALLSRFYAFFFSFFLKFLFSA